MSMRHHILVIALLVLPAALVGQVNRKGAFQISLGTAIGAHHTQYISTQTVAIPILGGTYDVKQENDDGAATLLFPIEVQYGLAKPVSIGLFLEPGSYLDSNNTRSNSLVLFGVQPRGYIINHDRFCWFASLQIGSSTLKITDNDGGARTESTYSGPFFGLGSGVTFMLGEHFGLQGHLRYMGSALQLKEYASNGGSVALSGFSAELNTTGMALQAGVAYRF